MKKWCIYADDEGRIELSVVFVTEQTEGRSVDNPYPAIEKLHLCKSCYEKVTKQGKQIFASGAMGYNEYFFRDDKNKNRQFLAELLVNFLEYLYIVKRDISYNVVKKAKKHIDDFLDFQFK